MATTLVTDTLYAYKIYDYETGGGYGTGYVDSNGYYGTINVTVNQSSNTITVSATFTPRYSGESINNCRFYADYNNKYIYGSSLPFSASFTYSSSADKIVYFGIDSDDNIDESIPAAWLVGNGSESEGEYIQGLFTGFSWNQPPTATITATNVVAGGNAKVSWTLSDPDGDDVKIHTSGVSTGFKRYYKASGATSFSSTALTISSTATSYTDAIPSSYEGGQIYYQLYIYDGQDFAYVTSPKYTVAEASNPPTTPSSITVPSSITEGANISISWGASTDADGDLSGYVLQYSLNGGSWTQAYKGSARSYTYSVPIGTETIAFRVKAYDSKSAESSYKTSSTVNVALDPSTLTFVEYIESTGTQYIDTGYYPNQNTRVVAEMEYVNHTDPACGLFGCDELEFYNWGSEYVYLLGTTETRVAGTPTNGQKIAIDLSKEQAGIEINGIETDLSLGEVTDFTGASTLHIHCLYRDGSRQFFSSSRTYSFQIYENGTLVRDFQPAINLNGEAGLYDAVNNKFYKNAGTGAFTVPRLYDSLPSGYILATYIESSGTQYIDTGVIPSTDIGIEVDFMLTTAQNDSSTGGIVSVEQVWPSNMYSIDAWAYRYGTAYQKHILTPNVKYHSVLQNGVFYQDGVEILTGANGKASTIPLYMFAVNTPSGAKEYANARIYYCKLYSGGTLVRDYLPCVEESTGKIGMFDLQDGVFYPFQGTYTVKAVVEGAINGYVNIDGINKKILREYENINGVLRLGSDWQTNIDGVLKSSSYEQEYTYDLGNPTYVWEKYTIGTKEGAPYTQTSGTSSAYIYYADTIYYASSYSFSSTTGKYTLKSPSSMTGQDFKTNYSTYDNYYFISGSSSGTVMYQSSGIIKGYATDSNNTTIGAIDISATRYYSTGTDIEVCGTYMYDVTSTNSSAYPSNGKHSDGYWYISDGTYVESSAYTWKKYNTKETEGAPYTQTESSRQTILTPSSYYWMAKSFSFDTSTGKYTLSSPSLLARSNIKSSTYKYFQGASTSSFGTYSAKNFMYQTTKLSSPSSLGYDSDGNYQGYGTTGYKYTATPSYTYSAGDYVSEVTSSSASAYPENGKHTDGYWYILKQIQ